MRGTQRNCRAEPEVEAAQAFTRKETSAGGGYCRAHFLSDLPLCIPFNHFSMMNDRVANSADSNIYQSLILLFLAGRPTGFLATPTDFFPRPRAAMPSGEVSPKILPRSVGLVHHSAISLPYSRWADYAPRVKRSL